MKLFFFSQYKISQAFQNKLLSVFHLYIFSMLDKTHFKRASPIKQNFIIQRFFSAGSHCALQTMRIGWRCIVSAAFPAESSLHYPLRTINSTIPPTSFHPKSLPGMPPSNPNHCLAFYQQNHAAESYRCICPSVSSVSL